MLKAHHVKLRDPKDFTVLVDGIASELEGTPLLAEARRGLHDKLSPLGLTPPSQFVSENMEVVLAGQGLLAAVIRAVELPREAFAEIALVSAEGAFPVLELDSVPDIKLEDGCIGSAREIARLSKRLGELSPNGKLLADKDSRGVFRRLASDQLRQDLSAIVGAMGDIPITSALLNQHEAFQDRIGQIEETLSDSDLATKRFVIYCKECGAQHLAFQSMARARSVVSEAGGVCVSCRQSGLDVVESFSLTEHVVKGLQQGLWLESLVSDLMARKCDVVWSGQMVSTNEVDVLGVYLGETILVECKDTSFGQNELYVTAIKAQDLDADTVVVATTRDVHPNVLEAKDRLDASPRGQRSFKILAGKAAATFQEGIDAVLTEVEQRFLQQLCQPESMSTPWLRLSRGEYMRLGV